ISEPLLFGQELCTHLEKVHKSVELSQSLADAAMTQDKERIANLRDQVSSVRQEMDALKLSLYAQVKDMHFHSASGPALNQYLACQDKVADAAAEFADLVTLHGAEIPAELHADLRAFVAQIANVSRRALDLTMGLSPESQSVCLDGDAPNVLDAVRQVHDENARTRQLETEFARRVHDREGQLAPAALLSLGKCGDALREMAANIEHAADSLYLMIRQT
ncbi:MAG: DUF47 family protein, partial [Phycisphaerales bacterium]